MLKFWYILRWVWIERLTYRMNFLLEVVSGIVSSLIVAFLWLAVYRSAGREIIGQYSTAEMVTYILGGGLINTFILNTADNPETSASIQNGTLSALLTQPIHPYAVWWVRDLGSKVFLFGLGLISYIFVWIFFREYILLPAAARHLGLFVIALLLAAALQFLLFQALSLLAFWIENTNGMRFAMRVIMEVVGGAIIPLSLFPQALQTIFAALPFPYLVYLPMRLYLGKISPSQAAWQLLAESAWIAGLLWLNIFLWRKGIRQYVSMGD
jgi:ABC-2 type transport system permease protein